MTTTTLPTLSRNQTVVALVLVALSIVAYFMCLKMAYGNTQYVYKDPMNVRLFKLPFVENCCSAWPVSHFLFFFVIGALTVGDDALYIGLGVGWEAFECIANRMQGKGNQALRTTPSTEEPDIEYSRWWAGSVKDVAFNALGFYAGRLLRRNI